MSAWRQTELLGLASFTSIVLFQGSGAPQPIAAISGARLVAPAGARQVSVQASVQAS